MTKPKYHPLPHETQKALHAEFHHPATSKTRQYQILVIFLDSVNPYLKYLANKLAPFKARGRAELLEDLVSEGTTALVGAFHRFDPDKAKFVTWSTKWAYFAMLHLAQKELGWQAMTTSEEDLLAEAESLEPNPGCHQSHDQAPTQS